MCSINGMINLLHPEQVSGTLVATAGKRLCRRGPDQSGAFLAPGVALYHNRLAVMDPVGGTQPMRICHCGKWYTIVYNGEVYNAPELRRTLTALGARFTTECDTEAVLWSYIFYGEECPKHLNGIFAFAVYDPDGEKVFLVRDRLGVKPLFYARQGGNFYFSSEIKGLLAHPGIRPEIDIQGLWQLLYLAPVTLPGSGVFKHVCEVLPGHALCVTREGMTQWPYWKLEAKRCEDSEETAVATVRELFCDAVERQLSSDVPLAVLLSGGLDSSAITAVAAEAMKREGRRLSTYSFEHEGNKESFRSTLFQPQGDDRFATGLAEWLGTEHTVLTAPVEAPAERLAQAVLARDLPGQADIDSSLLYYCEQIKPRHTVLLSGECSDEIFGGYPWFYRSEMLERDHFPWLHDPYTRIGLFDPRLVRPEEGKAYLREVCRDAVSGCPVLEGERAEDRTARIATWLSVRYFMASLLARKDRMSMYHAVEVRVPFADHRILEYVFNVPWRIKYGNGVEKALLRHAMEGRLPAHILWRKKSPYPKTHNPAYEVLVRKMLQTRVEREGGFLHDYLDRHSLEAMLSGESGTWFGQLMARPQLLAWLIQLDVWFEAYDVKLV